MASFRQGRHDLHGLCALPLQLACRCRSPGSFHQLHGPLVLFMRSATTAASISAIVAVAAAFAIAKAAATVAAGNPVVAAAATLFAGGFGSVVGAPSARALAVFRRLGWGVCTGSVSGAVRETCSVARTVLGVVAWWRDSVVAWWHGGVGIRYLIVPCFGRTSPSLSSLSPSLSSFSASLLDPTFASSSGHTRLATRNVTLSLPLCRSTTKRPLLASYSPATPGG